MTKLPHWPNPTKLGDIKLGLSRVLDLLARLQNPQENLPATIHLAGTNGKGSTLQFLRAIFEEAGLKTSCYTSPHLVEFNERIILNGQKISDEFLYECLEACRQAALQPPEIELTYFEGITVAAFLAFSKTKSDILLLETGMGGRLDATNILTQNLCSIITPISFDHTEFLGETLAKIAFEKAGIIKPNQKVVIGAQDLEALDAIVNQASKIKAKTVIFGEDYFCKINQNDWQFVMKSSKIINPNFASTEQFLQISMPFPSLIGKHQIENAATAIATALSQNQFLFSVSQLQNALTKAAWPARLQKIMQGKFFDLLKKNQNLYLDGSHNLQGASTVLEFLKTHQKTKRLLIFAMLQDKNCEDFLSQIKNEIDFLIALPITNEPKCRKPANIVEIAKKIGISAVIANNFDDAFKIISLQKEFDESLILICGSLYLAGDFLTQNN